MTSTEELIELLGHYNRVNGCPDVYIRFFDDKSCSIRENDTDFIEFFESPAEMRDWLLEQALIKDAS